MSDHEAKIFSLGCLFLFSPNNYFAPVFDLDQHELPEETVERLPQLLYELALIS